jgi:Ca-activated chloride channel family protein
MCLALIAGTALAVGAQQRELPLFRSGVELVRIDVAVTDAGQPVTGFGLADFEVRDDGVLQQLDSLHFEQVPLDIYFVLDMSQSVVGVKLAALREAGRAFLDGLTASDCAALLWFSHQIALREPLTGDLGRIRTAFASAEVGGGSTALRDALYAAMLLRTPNERRAALVVFSDGMDNRSWLSGDEVLDVAKQSDVVVYAVVAGPPGRSSSLLKNAFLRQVATATAGTIWEAQGDSGLRASFLQVLRNIRSRYVLAYYPQGVSHEGWHTLEVRLKGRRADIIARPGYYQTAPRWEPPPHDRAPETPNGWCDPAAQPRSPASEARQERP